MYKKILLIGIITFVVVVSGCTDNNTNKTNTSTSVDTSQKYFEVMGNATRDGDTEVKVPIRKLTNEQLYFYYTPYKNGVPEIGTWANVPQGINTTQKFMLSLLGPDMSQYDSFDIRACSDENGQFALQTEHITV